MKKKIWSSGAALAIALLIAPPLARADVVLDWNVIMLSTIGPQPPFPTSRFAAITHLAMFEAVNAITGRYDPYLGTIGAPSGASAEAAAAAAAHAVLVNYFPAKEAALDASLAASLAAVPDGQGKIDGIATGVAAARAMIALRAADGSGVPQSYLPITANPGEWQLTAGCSPAGGGFLHWRDVTPFGLTSPDQFRSSPPPVMTRANYRRDYDEVSKVGSLASADRPLDRTDVARFYAAIGPNAWASTIARQLAVAQGKSLSQNARAFALLSMAISDASVAVFETKYHYNFWRPETAIKAGDTDGNPKTAADSGFAPLITAPCFPSYPSGHATLSSAARSALEAMYGRGEIDVTLSTPALPGFSLHYTKLAQISDDIDDARVFGGIHFRFDQDAGRRQGRDVADYIISTYLRRVSQ